MNLSNEWYPLRFAPVYQERIWGGRDLWRAIGRETPFAKTAECWALSAHPHGITAVADGPLAGRSLPELVELDARGLLGLEKADCFPFLVKLIAAAADLSVQVHPDDEIAALHGVQSKTEAWYVLHAEPGARIIYGTKPGVTGEMLAAAVKDGRIIDCVEQRPVRAGDFIPLPAGCVHALGAGILVAEIQQSSDTTYRLYDWDRRDSRGKTRPLHIEEGLASVRFGLPLPSPFPRPGRDGEAIFADGHFAICLRVLRGKKTIPGRAGRMRIWTVAAGSAQYTSEQTSGRLMRGDCLLLPAACGDMTLEGGVELLETTAASASYARGLPE